MRRENKQGLDAVPRRTREAEEPAVDRVGGHKHGVDARADGPVALQSSAAPLHAQPSGAAGSGGAGRASWLVGLHEQAERPEHDGAEAEAQEEEWGEAAAGS